MKLIHSFFPEVKKEKDLRTREWMASLTSCSHMSDARGFDLINNVPSEISEADDHCAPLNMWSIQYPGQTKYLE